MKKKKLKLEELKIQSFITELRPEHAQTAKGGSTFLTPFTPEIYELGVYSLEWCAEWAALTYEGYQWLTEQTNNNNDTISAVIEYGGCLLPTVTIHG